MQTRLASATAATTAIAAAFIGCTSGIAPTEAPSPTPTVAATLAPSPSPALTLATSPSPPAVVTHSSVEFEPAFTYEAPAAWSTFDESQEGYVIGAGTPDAIVLQTDPIIATDAEQCEGLQRPVARRPSTGSSRHE
jgi:hypothetical protein